MFKKSSLILAATLIATLSAQTSASAIDIRNNVIDHRTPVEQTVPDHRTPPKAEQRTAGRKAVIDHRTTGGKAKRGQETRKNEVVIIKRINCRVGYDKLNNSGYRVIFTPNCTGNKYGYTAMKGGDVYKVAMHAFSGFMSFRRLGIVPPH